MKILSIRIKNLASLADEHFIDFESAPLAHAGLIAIVGKTGAGKSTILDAMCLALFNRVPRLKDSDGKLKDVDGSELLTNSPLTVLRRGTGHGFAELCFIAQDQKRYLARWEIKRARENPNGKLQSVQRHLKCLTDGVVLADKAKAVDEKVKQITQLSFEQFTRAVLLAQSEVTAFLKARDSERGELLEYLTNSSIFAKIGELAFRKTADIAKQRKQLEEFLGHIEILSDEDIAAFTEQYQQAEQNYQQLEQQKHVLVKQQQWFERKAKLEQEVQAKQQQFQTQQNHHQQLASEREQLKRLEVFSEIRPQVFQQAQNLQTLQQLEPQIQHAQTKFNELIQIFETGQKQYQLAEQQLKQTLDFEQQHQHALNQVRQSIQERAFIADEYKKCKEKRQVLEQNLSPLQQQQNAVQQHIAQLEQNKIHLQQQLTQTQQYAVLDKGLSAHLHQLGQFIQNYQAIEQQLGNPTLARQKLSEAKSEVEQLTASLGTVEQIELKLEQQRKDKDQKLAQITQLDLIQQKIKIYHELYAELQQFFEKQTQVSAQEQQLKTVCQLAEQDYQTAKTEREKLQHILQQQRLLHTENIEQLRANLKDGDACLVCGSTHHPYRIDDSAVSKALFDLQQQQEQQAVALEQTKFNAWQTQQHALTQCCAELEQVQKYLAQLQTKQSSLQQELDQQFSLNHLHIELNQPPEQILLTLNELRQAAQTAINSFDSENLRLAQAIKQHNQLVQSIQRNETLLNTAQQWQQQVQHIVECLSEAEQHAWQQSSSQTAKQTWTILDARTKQLEQQEQLSQRFEQQQQELKMLAANLEQMAKQIDEIDQNLQEITLKGQQNNEKAVSLIQQMTGRTDIKPHEWLIEHDVKRQQQQTAYHEAKQRFEQTRQHFEQQKQALDQLKHQHQHTAGHQQQIDEQIQNWLKAHTDFQATDLTALMQINSAQEQDIRNRLNHAERLLSEASSALKTMQEQLSEHLQTQPDIEYEKLVSLIQDNIAELKAQLEVRDRLKLKLEVHQQNLAKQQQYAEQIQNIQQEEHRWSKISGLIGDAKGKEFRDYAQQYHLDILVEHANQQLAMLSQRYTLKRLDQSLSLAIIDHDMDGETRSVASLSGGESFLTALALSLAIANMASGSMKIESLFIDEGFGTLDASSLHMVMNALDQLQNQGRQVILISHIQEMHERIPVQIQVKPLGAGASTIEVVG
ncbi:MULTISPECIES: SbcC/MukB-like Walker B domain-containing protein [Acinetobacter calcoaceticus/baumannii complex]|jgi:exonuclease SbcC|uniref:AAA family ATPase n=1 Tax=Acinetobacter pittii TaxID=48296 RepID=A0AAE9M700_ACIPI|nr:MULTISPECIES: AAA family ATPase [Acinetobacter calcoaceticus/baumannii complex]AZP30332.1 ATP-dependent dsDNA exonuclease [Acinetobacter pittii]EXE24640.1 AAA domain protein [Acinetobacter sp. 907131]EXS11696.1 AAA domain protein [Acinetobacter sp. 883425]MBK0411505.1 AAA family ATPase [Acinetobacter pittii]MBK1417654.1 AAA family ATPase [Acinetobacter pittii]